MIDDFIIDVGMHKGEDTEFYLKKGFRVVAIEADPALCERAEDRLKPYLASGRLTIVNAAIAETAGPATFYVNEKLTDWNTMREELVARNEKMEAPSRAIRVDGITFGEILDRFGVPYFLKVDIEGNDTLCVEALRDRPSTPKHISVESTKTTWSGLLHEFDLLEDLGFTRFKVVNQLDVPRQRSPDPPREGVYVNYKFVHGSSGLFGDEAPGAWLSRNQAVTRYRVVFAKYRLFGNDGLIANLHSRLPNHPRLRRLVNPGWYDTHATR